MVGMGDANANGLIGLKTWPEREREIGGFRAKSMYSYITLVFNILMY